MTGSRSYRRRLISVIGVATGLFAPGVAQADVTVGGPLQLAVTETTLDGADDVSVSAVGGKIRISEATAATWNGFGDCMQIDPTTVDCTPPAGPPPIGGLLQVMLGNGDNRYSSAGLPFSGQSVTELVTTGTGVDRLTAGSTPVSFLAGAGDDFLTGGPDADGLNGEGGNDQIDGGDGDDGIAGGPGNDTITAGAGNDGATGDDGDDAVDGGADDDIVSGGDGNDFVNGEAGSDGANGDGGNDTVHGGADDDAVLGGTGHDSVLGEGGDDQMQGGSGNDSIVGGADRDIFDCGAGTDSALADEDDLFQLPNDCDQRGGVVTSQSVITKAKFKKKNGKRKLKSLTAKLELECPATQAAPCDGSVVVKNGRTAITNPASFSITPGELGKAKIKFTKKAAKDIAGKAFVPVIAVATTTIPAGPTVNSTPVALVG